MPQVVDIVGTIAQSFNIGNAAVLVDGSTGTLESSIGFGFKNSGYVSNALIGVKTPLSNTGLTLTLHTGTEMLISNGRDTYNASTNPNGVGLLKSIRLLTSSDITLTLTALSTGVEKTYAIFYNNDTGDMVAFDENRISSSETAPSTSLFDVWRDATNNLFKLVSSGSWTAAHIIKVGTVVLNGSSITSLVPVMPLDLVKLNDYIANFGSENLTWNWQEFAASSTTTSTITLTGKACKNKKNLIISVEGIEIPNSAYSLDNTGYIVTFSEAVPAGLRILARWL